MKKVLILVDYQKDFVNGALGYEKALEMDDGLARLVQSYFDDEDGIVVATMDSHRKSYLKTLEGQKLPIEHCIIGTDGHDWYGKTGDLIRSHYEKYAEYIGAYDRCAAKTDKEDLYIITKNTFGSLELGDLLMELQSKYGLSSIEVAGIVTNMCVISNAVIAKAACPSVEITVNNKMVSSFNVDLHDKALEVMEGMQINVV